MHFSTLIPAIILVHLSCVSGLPIASLPRETSSTHSQGRNALPIQTPHLISKIGGARKPTTSPTKPSSTKSFDPVASALASKLSGINHQLSRFPIVQPHSTAEGKGAKTTTKATKTSTKTRKEKPTTTHRTKHHHKTTSEKDGIRTKSSLRIRAVHTAPTSHNIKLISAMVTTAPFTSSTPVVIPNPKATTSTTKLTTKIKSTSGSTTKTQTKSPKPTAKPTYHAPRLSPHPTPTSTSKRKSSTKTKITSHHIKTTTEKIAHTTTGPVKVIVSTPVPHPGEPHTGPGRYSPIAEMTSSRS